MPGEAVGGGRFGSNGLGHFALGAADYPLGSLPHKRTPESFYALAVQAAADLQEKIARATQPIGALPIAGGMPMNWPLAAPIHAYSNGSALPVAMPTESAPTDADVVPRADFDAILSDQELLFNQLDAVTLQLTDTQRLLQAKVEELSRVREEHELSIGVLSRRHRREVDELESRFAHLGEAQGTAPLERELHDGAEDDAADNALIHARCISELEGLREAHAAEIAALHKVLNGTSLIAFS